MLLHLRQLSVCPRAIPGPQLQLRMDLSFVPGLVTAGPRQITWGVSPWLVPGKKFPRWRMKLLRWFYASSGYTCF